MLKAAVGMLCRFIQCPTCTLVVLETWK